MSDPIVETPVAPVVETPTEPTDAPVILPDDHPLVKTLAAQKETLKELRAKAQRLDDIEEANKTELQKAQDRAEAAERDALTARLDAARSKVSASKGIPEELLTGSTQEELEASADRLLAFKGTTPTPPAAPPASPQGAVGDVINGSGPDLDTAIKAAQTARNFPLVATLKQQKAAQKG